MRTSVAALLLLSACGIEPLADESSEVTIAWQIRGIGDVPAACPAGDMLQFDTGDHELVPCLESGQRTVPRVDTLAVSLVMGDQIRTTTVADVEPGVEVLELSIYPAAAQLAAGWSLASRTGKDLTCVTANIDEVELRYALHEIDSQIMTARFPCGQTIGVPPALELGVYVGQLHALRDGVEVGKSTGMFFELDEVGSSRVDLQACKLEYSIVSPK